MKYNVTVTTPRGGHLREVIDAKDAVAAVKHHSALAGSFFPIGLSGNIKSFIANAADQGFKIEVSLYLEPEPEKPKVAEAPVANVVKK